MPDACVDCRELPRLHDLGSSYTETFPVTGPSGATMTVSLRLCLRCGARFMDRMQLRDYLRSKLPQYGVVAATVAARRQR